MQQIALPAAHDPQSHPQIPDTPDRVVPAWVFPVIFLAIPAWVLGWLDIWPSADGKPLVLLCSGVLFLGTCLVPMIYVLTRKQHSTSLVFMLASAIYLFMFGLRSYYLAAFPEVSLFPNFDEQADWIHLHRGLLWASLGLTAMAAGYFLSLRRRPDAKTGGGAIYSRVNALFKPCSSRAFVIILYCIGIGGRLYQLKTGAALYIYNSPSFDLIADRDNSSFGGALSLLADLCPLAFGAMIALQFRDRGSSLARSIAIWSMLLIMLCFELFYFLYGSYKFGLIGTLLIPWIVISVRAKRFSRLGLVLGSVFLFVLLPVVNASRETISTYYKKDMQPSVEWLDYMSQAARDAYTEDSESTARYFLDPLFARLTGSEALAVAEKYTDPGDYQWGKSYRNFFTLALPAALRPSTNTPEYIPWETKYVGFLSSNFTVVPMPALVESYLNFGVGGVCTVMFLMGLLYRRLDILAIMGRENEFAAGLYAYVAWRVVNLEQNLFIVLLPLFKLGLLLALLCSLWGYARRLVRIQRPAAIR